MGRSVLANELAARVRNLTDSANDTHISDPEMYLALTSAVADTWDKILAAGVGQEGIKRVNFSTVANQQEYPLDTIAADFFQLKTLYVDEGSGLLRPIGRVDPLEEQGLRPPTGQYNMRLHYVPAAPVFVTGAESFDGINGWEEHTVCTAALNIKAKKMDDTGPYRARIREIEARMKAMANRNQDSPPRIVRRARQAQWDRAVVPYSNKVTAWDIRGPNLELFYTYGVYIK